MLFSDSLNGDSTFVGCFCDWYVSVLMFDTMSLIGRSSILPLRGNSCNLQFHKTGYNFFYSYEETFDLNFLTDCYTFDSNVFVVSLSTCLKSVVVNRDIHFSIYLCLSILTTPLPLPSFRKTMFSFFDNYKTVFFMFIRNFALEYFLQVFLSLFLILLSSSLGIFEVTFNKFWKKSSNYVAIALVLLFARI